MNCQKEPERIPSVGNRLEGIDYPTALLQFGSEDKFADILKIFAAKTPPVLDVLKTLNADNIPDFLIAVHGLKGSLYGIFANEAGDAANELEAFSLAGDLEAIKEKLPRFITLCENLIAAIKKISQAGGAASGVETRQRKYAPDEDLLGKLNAAAAKFKTNEIEKLIEELNKFRYETDSDLVEWLTEQGGNLEYGAIVERLSVLRAGVSQNG
jgi:hypothetical protein